MMKSLIASSLRFRFLVIGLAVVLVLAGLRTADNIPMDVFPEFAPPLVEIQTEAPGLSTEEVDAFVTVPLERALNGSSWVKTIRSKSVLGLSSIVLIFEEGTDVLKARQLVQERLANVQRDLPDVARPPVMLAPLSALSRVMKIGLTSKELSMLELSELVRWRIRPQLMAVPGVANVAVWGERDRQLQVLVDPERLRTEGVTLDQVVAASRSAVQVDGGGFMDTPNQRLAVVNENAVRDAGDLAGVVVTRADGANRLLGDIAEVAEGHAPLIGEGVVNDGPGILLIVEKELSANTLKVSHDVERIINQLAPGLKGVEIDTTIFRPATFVEMSIENLNKALIIGVILVALVLAGFLFDWRTAVVSMTAIPISLLVAILVIDRAGGSLNTMILAGLIIALGEVVDDAIIDVENIARRLRLARESGAPFSRFKVVLEASLEVRSAVVYGSLVVVLVMMPVFFLEGLSGSFFRPLAASYILAIMASLVTALTLTPALSLILLARGKGRFNKPPLVRASMLVYERILRPLLRKPALAPVAAVLLTIGAGVGAANLGEELMPAFKEYDFLMHWVEKPGTSIDAMTRISVKASNELREIEGVRNFGAHIGRAEVADEVVGPNFTELWISLDPEADYDTAVAKVHEVIDGYPGIYRDVLTYLKERIKEVLTGASGSIVVRIFGPDLEVLRHEAQEVAGKISDIEGLVDLKVEPQVLVPQVKISLRHDALRQHGIDPGVVRQTIGTLVRGRVVGEIFEDQRVYRVAVWGTEKVRSDLASLREILIDLPQGGHVPLGELAMIEVEPTPNVIKREGASRRIDVTCNVRGADLASVAKEVERRVGAREFPRGYHPEVLGEYAEQRAARTRLLVLSIVSLVGMFLLLLTDFGSFKSSTMVMLGLPVALVGGIAGVFVSGGIITLGSFIGFVTVLGIAARNGIMMISHYRHLEIEEGMPFGLDLIMRGSSERVAPVLMTAITTGLALTPVAAAGPLPGQEIEYPMAVVIIGGLITSTLLSLLVIPCLYLMFGKGTAKANSME